MTERQAIQRLREHIGKREHHLHCSSLVKLQRGPNMACDCYAKGRNEAHEALDILEKKIA